MAQVNKRETVTGKDESGADVTVTVIRPTNIILQEAQAIYSGRMAALMRKTGDDRLMLREELNRFLNASGIWTDADQVTFVTMSIEIRRLEEVLRAGGIKLSEGREIAIQIRQHRRQLMEMYTKRSQYDGVTIEAHAEQHRLHWLMVRCSVKTDGTPAFVSIQDYLSRQDDDWVTKAAQTMAEMIFGYRKDFQKTLYEEQWLASNRQVDGNGHLVDSHGRLVNEVGQLVDASGTLVNEEGQRIDPMGRVLDETGAVDVRPAKPFIDDLNVPIVEADEATKVTDQPESSEPPEEVAVPSRRGRTRGRRRKS